MASLFEPEVELFGNNVARWGTGPPVNASDCVGLLFNIGDIIWNSVPSVGGSLGWYCTASSTSVGNPGTWSSVGDNMGGSQAGTAFVNSNVRLFHAQYSFANDGGVIGLITPKNNISLPINSVIINFWVNSTTAGAGATATVAVGTSAGSSAASLLAATAIASFSLNAFIHGIPTPQTATSFVKLTAAGSITITVAVAALTAGIFELYGEFYVSST